MWLVLIARLAKMRIVEEKQEMVEQVKVKIARKKSHLVATIKLCSSDDFYKSANSPVGQCHVKRRALSVGEDGIADN